ncbi:outer membrane lipoprotein-sorting protein [Variovorax sp. J22P271]|uniref:outer membrane lipoprotein-sorting protein n=1 Tax=Variovorax davisae TaxID=3053515 RepID=UPI00257781F6|nr:outer membrane lipoprotein-sorting protein [Variovorax sp. J22P271]MDM0034335.1 outer membrane lipoprotein-sorting protein [Variovorax sp. J22P271]
MIPFRTSSILLAFLLVVPLLGHAEAPMANGQSAAEILKKADSYRASSADLQLDVEIAVFNADGSPSKERRYTVFSQSQHRSLVLMQSPSEKGQKVLMLGDDFWLLMPGTSRPLRITAMQKLLGDVSTGDIATMSWAEDYASAIVGEEACAGQPCTHLSLTANRKSLNYQRIELWVGKIHREPIKAELFVQSDKLAKVARFSTDKPAAPSAVVEMTLLDRLSNNKETRVRYGARRERTLPAEWLNPMFLAANPKID